MGETTKCGLICENHFYKLKILFYSLWFPHSELNQGDIFKYNWKW